MTVRARTVFNVEVARALDHGQMIEITTCGRQSGQPRRVPLAFHTIDDRIYISGRPGRRGWYANLVAHPRFTFHLLGDVVADLPATARPITDLEERRRVLAPIAAAWGYGPGVMVAGSPLVEVTFEPGVR